MFLCLGKDTDYQLIFCLPCGLAPWCTALSFPRPLPTTAEPTETDLHRQLSLSPTSVLASQELPLMPRRPSGLQPLRGHILCNPVVFLCPLDRPVSSECVISRPFSAPRGFSPAPLLSVHTGPSLPSQGERCTNDPLCLPRY